MVLNCYTFNAESFTIFVFFVWLKTIICETQREIMLEITEYNWMKMEYITHFIRRFIIFFKYFIAILCTS